MKSPPSTPTSWRSCLEEAAKSSLSLAGIGFSREDLDYLIQRVASPANIPSGTFDVAITLYDEREADELEQKLRAEGYPVELEAVV